ncbi:hypothetical protein NCS52_01245200 [Fusarium sp. LHS14.1]|nr:hypothetical protein NCS52_01245200 [Fusarium sp. LHS14.1]
MAKTDQMCLDNAACKLIARRPINLDPASKSSFDLAREWFQTCLADHTKCPKPSLNFMPKRVISISQAHSGFSLRLLETEGLHDMYCALSYCWGGDQKTKATKETLPQLQDGIALDKLPATLQDAVTTTHGLGLRYLFVDSLCILQDDEEDIHTQIAQMSEIYSEAAVTILASRANGVDFTFLHKRQSSLPSSRLRDKRYKISLRCSGDELGSVVVLSSYSSSKESSGPLVSRAWALQENLLSARTLDYEDYHTTWRCSTINNLTDGWLSTSEFLHRVATDETEHRDERQELFRQWRWLVKHYARLELSYPSDKLPAISAIAGRMGSALGDKYLAGIWKSRLPQDLLWDVRQRHPRPKGFRAPSWSWAAVDGDPARISTENGSLSLEVLECHTELKSPAAPYGAVTGGHLVVRGRLRRLVLSGIKGRIWTPFGKPTATKVKLANLFHVVEPGCKGSEAWMPMNFDAVEQEFQDNAVMDIAMLEVYEHESGPCYGLVLRPVGPQRFSRLGVFGYLYGPEDLDQGSSPGSDTGGELEGVEEWEPLYENWLQGFGECDFTTVTLV